MARCQSQLSALAGRQAFMYCFLCGWPTRGPRDPRTYNKLPGVMQKLKILSAFTDQPGIRRCKSDFRRVDIRAERLPSPGVELESAQAFSQVRSYSQMKPGPEDTALSRQQKKGGFGKIAAPGMFCTSEFVNH